MASNIPNPKSDIQAKRAFVAFLEQQGDYDSVRIASQPVDVIALKNDVEFFFEIKFTTKRHSYFGAATLTEWRAALHAHDRFWFVIAVETNGDWNFRTYSPTEFLRFSYVPPFKIYFNIAMADVQPRTNRVSRKRPMTIGQIEQMSLFYETVILQKKAVATPLEAENAAGEMRNV